jgi:hypothetical protein
MSCLVLVNTLRTPRTSSVDKGDQQAKRPCHGLSSIGCYWSSRWFEQYAGDKGSSGCNRKVGDTEANTQEPACCGLPTRCWLVILTTKAQACEAHGGLNTLPWLGMQQLKVWQCPSLARHLHSIEQGRGGNIVLRWTGYQQQATVLDTSNGRTASYKVGKLSGLARPHDRSG